MERTDPYFAGERFNDAAFARDADQYIHNGLLDDHLEEIRAAIRHRKPIRDRERLADEQRIETLTGQIDELWEMISHGDFPALVKESMRTHRQALMAERSTLKQPWWAR